jgi:hypothetical protein
MAKEHLTTDNNNFKALWRLETIKTRLSGDEQKYFQTLLTPLSFAGVGVI